MYNTDEEQLKDQLEHELDVFQLLDLMDMDFRDLINTLFDAGISEEIRQKLERSVR
jgi:hypothetical protein